MKGKEMTVRDCLMEAVFEKCDECPHKVKFKNSIIGCNYRSGCCFRQNWINALNKEKIND